MNDVIEAFYGEDANNSPIDPKSLPVRFSRLKEMARSPAHYLSAIQHDRKDTRSMKGGRAVHCLLFGTPYAVFPGAARSGKAWQTFSREHADMEILLASELARAGAMAAAVERHPEAKRLFAGCKTEQTLEWTHELNRDCVSRLDAFCTERVVELKTTKCSQPERFVRDGTWRSYHAQLAWYQDAVAQSGSGTPPTEAYIVAVESSRPYPVTVLRLTDNAIDFGRRQCRLWMERLLVCESFNEWPEYVESIVPFDVDDGEGLVLSVEGEEFEF